MASGFETLQIRLTPEELASARTIANQRTKKGRRFGATNLVPDSKGDYDFKGAIGELAFSLAIERPLTETSWDRLSMTALQSTDVDKFQVRTSSRSDQGLRVRVQDNLNEIYVLVELEFQAKELKPTVVIAGWAYGHEVKTNGQFRYGVGNAPDYYQLETYKLRPIIDLFLEGDYWPSLRAKFPEEIKRERQANIKQPTECTSIQFDLWENFS